jgi:hypothetical protein
VSATTRNAPACSDERADPLAFAEQRHRQDGADLFRDRNLRVRGPDVPHLYRLALDDGTIGNQPTADGPFLRKCYGDRSMVSDAPDDVAIPQEDARVICPAHSRGVGCHGAQHRLEIRWET